VLHCIQRIWLGSIDAHSHDELEEEAVGRRLGGRRRRIVLFLLKSRDPDLAYGEQQLPGVCSKLQHLYIGLLAVAPAHPQMQCNKAHDVLYQFI